MLYDTSLMATVMITVDNDNLSVKENKLKIQNVYMCVNYTCCLECVIF